MSHPVYVADAFTSRPFAGNPAGVCVLAAEADVRWMQSVAAEMKHAETAFLRQLEDGWELRWFTPSVEVDLCGHATLASAHILWETGRVDEDKPARFHTRSGLLVATKGDTICLDFPTEAPSACDLPRSIIGLDPTWTGMNRIDWIVEVSSESDVRGFQPDMSNIESLGKRGLIVTARGSGKFDFVSRFFAPQSGVPEDSATGSAHCCLAPYWASKLGRHRMTGFQASERGGVVGVELCGDRTHLLGEAVTVLAGTLFC